MNTQSSEVDVRRSVIIGGGIALIVLGLLLFLAGEARSRRVQQRRRR